MTFSAHATGLATRPFADTLIADLADEIAGHGYPVTRQENALAVALPVGWIEAKIAGEGFAVTIAARDVGKIHEMREALLHLLDHVAPQLSDRMSWQGDLPTSGIFPPNFRLARFISRERISPNFLRLTLGCEAASSLLEGGMHFRLAIPPEGRTPVWPRLDASGRSIWPKGEDALHRPAYTFVEVDPEKGRFSFDLYLHEGGLATTWAASVRPGEEVGVAGPGGGELPPGAFMVIAGDETALPAIRRIVETSRPDRRGHAFIELGDPADRVEMAAPAGMTVTWLIRGEGPGLWDAILSVPFPPAGESRFVWIAAERDLAREARKHFRDGLGVSLEETYISAYWTR
ncbi:siderophore-interacting protein [Jiella avicenniae]|uniref:Siderophore-interacting protein n=1 Tax=Jiella avicenniae TaxID=2907202 RepID=A0A9X1P232_9HYPH|nr:siderophore-interacting protein [Jiella avicenniae]MCE7029093.1 siderophore-interacting protein [Jiella avicenniae]